MSEAPIPAEALEAICTPEFMAATAIALAAEEIDDHARGLIAAMAALGQVITNLAAEIPLREGRLCALDGQEALVEPLANALEIILSLFDTLDDDDAALLAAVQRWLP